MYCWEREEQSEWRLENGVCCCVDNRLMCVCMCCSIMRAVVFVTYSLHYCHHAELLGKTMCRDYCVYSAKVKSWVLKYSRHIRCWHSIQWFIIMNNVRIYVIKHAGPMGPPLAWQKLTRTVQVNFSTKSFCTCHADRHYWLLQFYASSHSLTLTIARITRSA